MSKSIVKSPSSTIIFTWCLAVFIFLLMFIFVGSFNVKKKGNCYTYRGDGDSRSKFLLEQLKRESNASLIIYITPDLTNAIATDEYLRDYIEKKKLKESTLWKDNIDGVSSAMKSRKDSLELSIKNERVKVIAIFKSDKVNNQVETNDSVLIRRYLYAQDLARQYPSHLSLYCISSAKYDSLIANNSGLAIIIGNKKGWKEKETEKISIVRAKQAHETIALDMNYEKITNLICEEDVNYLSSSLYLKITALSLNKGNNLCEFGCFNILQKTDIYGR